MTQPTTMLGTFELVEPTPPKELVTTELAYQPFLEREAVIHRLAPGAAKDPRARGRFIKQARLLAELRHHNIISVYDAGTYDGIPYIALEHLKGITLQQRLDQLANERTRMDPHDAARIVFGIADAVEHAHKHGVVVHNLVPSNIVLTSDGRTMLTSIGEHIPAHLFDAPAATLAYASPEVLFGGAVDGRSDVYALGVLLYHLLFNRLPFEGSSASIITQKQGAATLPALDDPRTELPCTYALVYVMRQATVRKPEQRYSSVAAFRQALAYALDGRPAKLYLRPRPSSDIQQRMHLRRLQRAADRARQNGARSVTVVPRAPEPAGGAPILKDGAAARLSAFGAPVGQDDAVLRRPVQAPVMTEQAADDRPAVIDHPLIPGRDQPALQAALPYTLLVPMAGSEEAELMPAAAALAMPGSARIAFYAFWIFVLGLLVLMTIGAATLFG